MRMFARRRRRSYAWCIGLGLLALAFVVPSSALADGTETLGTPSVPVAAGTGALVAGVGTETSQPQSFSFTVPGTPKQVLLYWTGQNIQPAGLGLEVGGRRRRR